jgi:UDP:flavonoid glycosyltransferase YjiC (YdhE family)
MIALARRMQKSGHEVTFLGHGDLETGILRQGFRFFVCQTPTVESSPTHQANYFTRILNRRDRLDAAVDGLGIADFNVISLQLQPDLFVVDLENHEYIMSASMTGVPVVITTAFLSLSKQPNIPPLHRLVIPEQEWWGQFLFIELHWLYYRLRKRIRRYRQWLQTAGVDWFSVLRHHANRVGFPFKDKTDPNQWLIPFSYRSIPILNLNAQELDFKVTNYPDTTFGGPIIDDARHEVALSAHSDSSDLPSFSSASGTSTVEAGARKLIYVSFGSYAQIDDSAFWKRFLSCLGLKPDWDVIIGLGGRLKPEALGVLPPNVRAFEWVPQLAVLREADCAVIHGGISTINECIHSDVPMVVYPYDTTDQFGNAARVICHKLGVLGDRIHDDSSAMLQHIDEILKHPSYKQNVMMMRNNFLRYDNENVAVRYLESQMNSA